MTGPTTPPKAAPRHPAPAHVRAGHRVVAPVVGAPDIPSAAPAPVPDEEKRKRAGVVVRGERSGIGGGFLFWRVGRVSAPPGAGLGPVGEDI